MHTEKFGSIDPVDDITNTYSSKLMDFLPCVKAGFLLYRSLTSLFYIYIENNNVREKSDMVYFHFDDFMTKIFVEMDAEFYTDPNCRKVLMTEALEQGIIENPLSTQDVIGLRTPHFRRCISQKSYPNHYVVPLVAHNYYSKNDLIRLNEFDILETINHEIIEEQMIKEYDIIASTHQKWKEYNLEKIK